MVRVFQKITAVLVESQRVKNARLTTECFSSHPTLIELL
jgi:hypothetical protein